MQPKARKPGFEGTHSAQRRRRPQTEISDKQLLRDAARAAAQWQQRLARQSAPERSRRSTVAGS